MSSRRHSRWQDQCWSPWLVRRVRSVGVEECQTKRVRVVIKAEMTTYPSRWPHIEENNGDLDQRTPCIKECRTVNVKGEGRLRPPADVK